METITAPVFDISRCSFHDGPGVRTVVYIKGCSLHCLWCHNPESRLAHPQILFHVSKCIGCGRCAAICPKGLHYTDAHEQHIFDRGNCISCGSCAENCPAKALELCGANKTAAFVMSEIIKDKNYYRNTGGGVTLSGGEALLYPEFAAVLFELCRSEGIHTAVETALYVPQEKLDRIFSLTDLLIADFKHSDSETHKRLTGASNAQIKGNLRYAAKHHSNIWIRIPLIPGLNDSDENLIESAKFIKTLGGAVKRVELLKFNNLYENKYAALGLSTSYLCDNEPQSDDEIKRKYDIINEILNQ